jgi:hypothetical protein
MKLFNRIEHTTRNEAKIQSTAHHANKFGGGESSVTSPTFSGTAPRSLLRRLSWSGTTDGLSQVRRTFRILQRKQIGILTAVRFSFPCISFQKGTPMNTNAFDMKNQLAFLGMQDAYPILSVQDLGRNSSQARIPGNVHRQSSLFLMRPIMMRQQTYRGTTTTLMSLPPKVSTVSRRELAFNRFLLTLFDLSYLKISDGTSCRGLFIRC